MGLRSAFNPLGALPYPVTVSYSTVEWDVTGLVSGVYPTSWTLSDGAGGSSVVQTSACNVSVSGSVVTFSCAIPNGWSTVASVTTGDGNYSPSVQSS